MRAIQFLDFADDFKSLFVFFQILFELLFQRICEAGQMLRVRRADRADCIESRQMLRDVFAHTLGQRRQAACAFRRRSCWAAVSCGDSVALSVLSSSRKYSMKSFQPGPDSCTSRSKLRCSLFFVHVSCGTSL